MELLAEEDKKLMVNLELQLKALLSNQRDDRDYQLIFTKALNFVLLPLTKKAQVFIDSKDYIVSWEFFDYTHQLFNVSVIEDYTNIGDFAMEAIGALEKYRLIDECQGCIQWKKKIKDLSDMGILGYQL